MTAETDAAVKAVLGQKCKTCIITQMYCEACAIDVRDYMKKQDIQEAADG